MPRRLRGVRQMVIDQAGNGAPLGSGGDGGQTLVDPPFNGPLPKRYDAFISYSHEADRQRAAALQTGLQRLAKPFLRIRSALRVFRDDTGLAANAGLWPSICEAIDGSDWFVLLASPASARSEWVGREIERWLATRPSDRVLVVVTGGECVWDPAVRAFDLARSSAIHPALAQAFREEPRVVDLTWAKAPSDLSLSNSQFVDVVAEIAAPIHGLAKDELEGDEIRQQRTARRVRRAVVTAMAMLLVVAIAAAGLAVRQRESAERQHQLAVSRQLAVQSNEIRTSDPRISMLLAAQAWDFSETPEARYAMLDALAQPGRAVLTGHTGGVRAVAFSPDGTTMASAGGDGVVRLWDTTTHRQVGDRLDGGEDSVLAATFGPGGDILVTAAGSLPSGPTSHVEVQVRVWDVASGRRFVDFQITAARTLDGAAIAISPDGGTLAAISIPDSVMADSPLSWESTISLWDVMDGRQISELPINGSPWLDQLTFSPNGQLIALTGLGESTVQLWDLTRPPSGQPRVFQAESGLPAVAFSPNGAILAAGTDNGRIRLWNVPAGLPVGEITAWSGDLGSHVETVTFSRDGTMLAAAGVDRVVRLWKLVPLPTGQPTVPIRLVGGFPIGTGLNGHADTVLTLAFSADGRTLASGGLDSAVRLWDLNAATRRGRQRGQWFTGHPDEVPLVALAPDGRTLAFSTAGGASVQLWDVDRRRPKGEPLAGPPGVFLESMTFSPDGTTLAAVGHDGTALAPGGPAWFWDLETHHLQGELPTDGAERIMSPVAFSPDGTLIAATNDDGSVSLWDVETRRRLSTFFAGDAERNATSAVAFSPNGATLALGGWDGSVQFWDIERHRAVGQHLAGHTSEVGELAFSPDGDTLASSGGDHSVRLWDVEAQRSKGQLLIPYTLNHLSAPIAASVSFSLDSKTLVASIIDEFSLRLWDVDTQRPIGQPLSGHTARVLAATFSSDRNTLVTAAADGTIRMWGAPTPDDPAAAICAAVTRPMSEEEWNHYLAGEPYRPVCD